MVPDVSVIVVTWNARELVDRCLDAVLGAGGAGVSLEVLVVDNDSSDDTVAHVRERWGSPLVRVIETGRNGGMAAGNNAGMLAARGRSFLLLNSDAFLEPGALSAMLATLDAGPEERVAAVVPRLVNDDGSPQRSVRGWPTVWRYATELLYLRRLAPRSRVLNAFYGGGLDLSAPREVEWATGACLLVPRGAVDEVGLMDEAYVMYGEEVDWLRRMDREARRRVRWEPRAVAVHLGGGSARTDWGRLYQLQLRNHVRYMALREGARAGRRTQRLLRVSLQARAAAWRVLGVLPAGRRDVRRARAAAFADGARTVAQIDVDRLDAPEVPMWPLPGPSGETPG